MADYNRSYFADELADPRVRDRLFALTQAEVGGQGPDAQQAFLETVFNRASARRGSLLDTMSVFDPRTRAGYYPSLGSPSLLSDDQRNYFGNLLTRVMAGSDISGGATGNASGDVGFAGGPQTSAYGGERFGIEGPDVGRSLPRFMAYAPSDTGLDTINGGRVLPPEITTGRSNPAPAMPNLPVVAPGMTPQQRIDEAFGVLPGVGKKGDLPRTPFDARFAFDTGGESGVTPNQRVAQAFEDLQGGPTATGTPTGGTLPSATTARSIPSELMGEGGGFGGGNLPLILMALGGGIAQGGIGPGLTNAAQLAAYLQHSQGTPADVKEFQYAVANGMFKGSYADWLKFKANLANKGGLNPIYYRDQFGNVRIGQPTTGGEFRDINVPGQVMTPQIQVDQGNQINLVPRLAVPGGQGAGAPGAPGAAPGGQPAAPGANSTFQKNFVPKAEQTQQGEFFGKQYAEFQKDSINSTRVKGILDYTAQLSPDAYSGAAAPLVNNIRSALSTFGINPGKAPIGDMLTSLGNEMTIRSLGGLGRQISDGDRVYMASVFPSLADTAEGRMMKIAALRKLAQRQEDVAAFAEQWINDPRNQGSLKGFSQALAKWSDENPLFPDPRKGGAAPGGGGGWSITPVQ